MAGGQDILEMRENPVDLGRFVEKLDDDRQVERQVEQRRGVHLAGTSETADAPEYRDATDLLVVVQLGEQRLERFSASVR